MKGTYRVKIDKEAFRIDDPIVTGQQLLDLASKRPTDEYLIFQKLKNGQMEEIRLDETVDLRRQGIEQFITWHSDRSFRFSIDGRRLEWGAPLITGLELKKLAEVDAATHVVWLDVRGGEDLLIEDAESVDLQAAGIERFFTKPRPQNEFEIIVNARPKTVQGPEVTFEQIVDLAFPGPHKPTVVFSVTYSKADSVPPTGELGAGGSVNVKTGTIFNVTPTDKS
ncbi:MAG: multiubiquitin domain-containing protein [Cyanobacteria bacterium P01_D01_bin.6]